MQKKNLIFRNFLIKTKNLIQMNVCSTSNDKSSSVPSWISINSTTGVIKISAPSVSVDTTYSFYVISKVSGVTNSVRKFVKITVSKCQVVNCQIWSSSSTFVWTDWNNGYSLRFGTWVKNTASETWVKNTASATSQGLQFTNVLIIWAIFVIVALMSLLNLSSMASLWGMVNQVQIFLLLLLTRAYIPIDLQNIITGTKFSLNIASYINFQSFGFFGSILEEFDFKLSDQSLDSLNIKSNSSLFNISPTIIFALMINRNSKLNPMWILRSYYGNGDGICLSMYLRSRLSLILALNNKHNPNLSGFEESIKLSILTI